MKKKVTPIRAITERLTWREYAVRKKVKSQIDNDGFYWEETGLICPSCKVVHQPLENREAMTCCACGLKIRLVYGVLECTKEFV